MKGRGPIWIAGRYGFRLWTHLTDADCKPGQSWRDSPFRGGRASRCSIWSLNENPNGLPIYYQPSPERHHSGSQEWTPTTPLESVDKWRHDMLLNPQLQITSSFSLHCHHNHTLFRGYEDSCLRVFHRHWPCGRCPPLLQRYTRSRGRTTK